MNKIRLLDELTIQKIAAGEVIEEPASVVKELIENSIDAGSNNITIEVKKGGKTYIRVTDNGEGIYPNDLDIAFKQHSTSKLERIEDLYSINSLGFRGEALSSMASVAKIEVMTKTEGAKGGLRALIENGEMISKELVGSPKGTTIIVRDLFYNIPVRKEFLKSDRRELNRISDIVYRSALGNPDCSFRFIADDKVILNTPKDSSLKNHIYSILGKEFTDNLIYISENGFLKISGYISNNKLYRGNRSHQYIYVNGRYITNNAISKEIENIYKGIIPLNRFPIFIIFIEIDPDKIDVNIHPNKEEIKFSQMELVLGYINKIVREHLIGDIRVPRANIKRNKPDIIEDFPSFFDEGNVVEGLSRDEIIIKDFRTGSGLGELDSESFEVKEDEPDLYKASNKDTKIAYRPGIVKSTKDNIIETEIVNREIFDKGNYIIETKNEEIIETIENLEPIGVIFKTYILAVDKIKEEFYFIDQHAAHERIMYEKFFKEFSEEKIVTQQLLSPIVLDLTNKEVSQVEENKDLFNSLGFDIDIFGNSSVILRGLPMIFGDVSFSNLFLDILDNIDKTISSSYDLKIEKIMKISCVNSVKSGDSMDELEILALFDSLKQCKNPYTCPHGRPTLLKMSKKDIEKEFLRIM